MPLVTALREVRRGRVAVELDGAPWRTLPAEVVVRAELSRGRALDRQALRILRRELRRAEALELAGRALRTRDLTTSELTRRLEHATVGRTAARESMEVLARAGVLDDARVACRRAEALADRAYGNAAIRLDLEQRGVPAELVEEALSSLEPELERARRVTARRGPGPQTARYLAGKGFGDDSIGLAGQGDFANDP